MTSVCPYALTRISGGWDWAPYGSTFAGGAHTFSKGIVRSVYLVPVNQIAIEHVVPQIFYSGSVRVLNRPWKLSIIATQLISFVSCLVMPCPVLTLDGYIVLSISFNPIPTDGLLSSTFLVRHCSTRPSR